MGRESTWQAPAPNCKSGGMFWNSFWKTFFQKVELGVGLHQQSLEEKKNLFWPVNSPCPGVHILCLDFTRRPWPISVWKWKVLASVFLLWFSSLLPNHEQFRSDELLMLLLPLSQAAFHCQAWEFCISSLASVNASGDRYKWCIFL